MKRFALSAAGALCLAYGSLAYADPPKDPPKGVAATTAPAGDAAAAQALFYEARQLMKENKFGLACPKLEESLRLDYGIGTEFNLADCNEKLGKVATAWSGYLNVASAAHTSNQKEREKVARERAKALEPRLPKLEVDVPATAPQAIEVRRDGTVVGAASWSVAVPVDPGTHKITASAPGKQPWEGKVDVAEGKIAKIAIPALQDAPVAVAAAPAPAPTTPAAGPAQQTTQSQTTESFPEPIVESPGQTQRTVGWIVSGLGIASLGVGAGFGIDSLANHNSAKSHCSAANVCDSTGLSDRRAAMTAGNVSTITSIAGAGALLGGVILVLTAPHSPSREKAPETGWNSIRFAPQVGTTGGGLSLQGNLQ